MHRSKIISQTMKSTMNSLEQSTDDQTEEQYMQCAKQSAVRCIHSRSLIAMNAHLNTWGHTRAHSAKSIFFIIVNVIVHNCPSRDRHLLNSLCFWSNMRFNLHLEMTRSRCCSVVIIIIRIIIGDCPHIMTALIIKL